MIALFRRRRNHLDRHKPPVVMFDFDGVLADSFDIFFEEFTAAVRELGYENLNSRESFLRILEGNPFIEMTKMGFPLWKLKQLGEHFGPRIRAANERIQPFEGVLAILSELAERHPVYVITSNQTDAVRQFLERHGVSGVRDVIGSDKESSKVKKIRRVKKYHPECHGWYIGDTKGDMLEAATAGATTIAVTWGWHSVDKLLEAKPDHVVHQREDLRALLMGLQAN
jgi:phosphoglycolate phosphatase